MKARSEGMIQGLTWSAMVRHGSGAWTSGAIIETYLSPGGATKEATHFARHLELYKCCNDPEGTPPRVKDIPSIGRHRQLLVASDTYLVLRRAS